MKIKKKQKNKLTFTQKTILAIIVLVFIAVIVCLICLSIFNPERIVKNTVSSISANYYETQIYNNILSANKNDTEKTSQIISEYNEKGFSSVLLRTLLLNEEIDVNNLNLIKSHCDEDSTFVKFYPEPPYSKTSYRMDFTYKCNF